MATPDYSILQNLPQMQTPNYVGSLIGGLQAAKEAELKKQESALRTLQTQREEAALAYLPKEQQMREESHRASIEANKLNMQATRLGMGTTTLQQQQLKQQMALAKQKEERESYQWTAQTVSSVLGAPKDLQQPMLEVSIKAAEAKGFKWPTDVPRDINNPQAQAYLKYLEQQSGKQLDRLKAEQIQADTDLKRAQAAGASGGGIALKKYEEKKAEKFANMMDDAVAKANAANESTSLANKFIEVVDKIPGGTGPIRQYSAMLTPEGQEAQSYSQKLTFAELKKSLTGTTSDNDIKSAEKATVGIGKNTQTNKKIAQFIIAGNQRQQEQVKFYQTLANMGIVDQGLAQAAWSNFIKENPLFDAKSGTVIENHIGNWQAYITPEYLQDLSQGKSKSPVQKTESTNASQIKVGEIVTGADGKKWKKIEGGYVPA